MATLQRDCGRGNKRGREAERTLLRRLMFRFMSADQEKSFLSHISSSTEADSSSKSKSIYKELIWILKDRGGVGGNSIEGTSMPENTKRKEILHVVIKPSKKHFTVEHLQQLPEYSAYPEQDRDVHYSW